VDEKSLQIKLYDAIVEMTCEFRIMRKEAAERDNPHVTINAPRVSLDTVLLCIASSLIAGSIMAACAQ
jgi:hypothetical protein